MEHDRQTPFAYLRSAGGVKSSTLGKGLDGLAVLACSTRRQPASPPSFGVLIDLMAPNWPACFSVAPAVCLSARRNQSLSLVRQHAHVCLTINLAVFRRFRRCRLGRFPCFLGPVYLGQPYTSAPAGGTGVAHFLFLFLIFPPCSPFAFLQATRRCATQYSPNPVKGVTRTLHLAVLASVAGHLKGAFAHAGKHGDIGPSIRSAPKVAREIKGVTQ